MGQADNEKGGPKTALLFGKIAACVANQEQPMELPQL